MAEPKKEKRNNLWMVDFYYTDVHGERQRKKLHNFKTKKEAMQGKIDFLNKVKELPLNEKSCTVHELFNLFCESRPQWEYNTKAGYVSVYKVHIEPHFKDTKVRALNHTTIIKWIAKLQNNGISNYRINTVIAKFKTMISFYNQINNENNNAFNNIQNLKFEQKKDYKVIDVEDFYKLINNAVNFNDYVMFWFIFWTGIRPGELYALQWKKIDFANNSALISNSLRYNNKKDWELKSTKNGKNRTIYFDEQTKDLLCKLKNEKSKYDCFNDDFFVFRNKIPVTVSLFTQRLERACIKANIGVLRPHGLRHSFVSNMSSHINDLKVISEYIGHANTNITAKVYEHTLKDSNKKIVNAITELSNKRL